MGMRNYAGRLVPLLILLVVTVSIGACAKKKPPVARPMPPPPSSGAGTPSGPPQPVDESPVVPPAPVAEDKVGSKSIDDLNRDSPLKPVFFALDSAEVEAAGQQVLNANADVLKKYPTWTISVEGHCDERGTAEYNLALGERRALAARSYLVSLGIAPDRLRTVSYGKEFPFDPGHSEEAWAKNRRAHCVVTAK
jgi:peptidoglycan-associated lipoprotein